MVPRRSARLAAKNKRAPKPAPKPSPKPAPKPVRSTGKQCDKNNIKATNPLYICNPVTGIWVLRSGKIGKNIKEVKKITTTLASRIKFQKNDNYNSVMNQLKNSLLLKLNKNNKIDLDIDKNFEKDIIENTETLKTIFYIKIHNIMHKKKDFVYKKMTYKCVMDIFQKIPKIETVVRIAQDNFLKSYLDNIHPELYNLLKWIIYSPNKWLKPLLESDVVSHYNQVYSPLVSFDKYLVIPKEGDDKIFQDAKKIHGSKFGWHGSGDKNWIKMIKDGFNIGSSPVNGWVYGRGVYLAKCETTSLMYSNINNISSYRYLASCEYITDKKEIIVKVGGKMGTIIVVPNENFVKIRILFIKQGKRTFLFGT